MFELVHVELSLHVLVFVVFEHIHFSLQSLLPLEHFKFFVPVVEVVEVSRPIGTWWLLSLTDVSALILLIAICQFDEGFPLQLLVRLKHLVMIHQF